MDPLITRVAESGFRENALAIPGVLEVKFCEKRPMDAWFDPFNVISVFGHSRLEGNLQVSNENFLATKSRIWDMSVIF